MKKTITMRSLLAEKTDQQVLNYLRGLHVGISCDHPRRYFIAGSMWTPGSFEPTIEFVRVTRANLEAITEKHEKFFSKCPEIWMQCWLDKPLHQYNNWENRSLDRFMKTVYNN